MRRYQHRRLSYQRQPQHRRQTGAEAAEDGARQYAEDTGADRQAVANDKQVVSQMREAVAADRKAVEQTALQFGQTAQDALTAIGQAQSTAVGMLRPRGRNRPQRYRSRYTGGQ